MTSHIRITALEDWRKLVDTALDKIRDMIKRDRESTNNALKKIDDRLDAIEKALKGKAKDENSQ